MASRNEVESELAKHWPRLRRFAYSLCRDAADGDDLLQDVAIRALGSAAHWQAGTRFDSWIFRVARNLWIDTLRSRARRDRGRAPAEEAEWVGEDPRPGLEATIDLKRAMGAMQQLPAEQREVVALILIDGMGYREVAELLALPIGTVSSRLVRGRTALLALLGEKQ
jgi:RNA polymerase sigma-70 factor (ECF subfamily)